MDDNELGLKVGTTSQTLKVFNENLRIKTVCHITKNDPEKATSDIFWLSTTARLWVRRVRPILHKNLPSRDSKS